MKLEFVELWLNSVQLHKVVNLLRPKVGHANEASSLHRTNELLHALPSFDVVEARFIACAIMRPVDEPQVEIVQL